MTAEIFGVKIPIDEHEVKNDSTTIYFGWDAISYDTRQRLADRHSVGIYYCSIRNKSYATLPSRLVLLDGVRSDGVVCECGADSKGFPTHMFYCGKWEKYGA